MTKRDKDVLKRWKHLVVNVDKVGFDGCDVYVGRHTSKNRACTKALPHCICEYWANPFRRDRETHASRDTVCDHYWMWLRHESCADYRAKVRRELKGKTLGCRCVPKRCHAVYLAAVANEPLDWWQADAEDPIEAFTSDEEPEERRKSNTKKKKKKKKKKHGEHPKMMASMDISPEDEEAMAMIADAMDISGGAREASLPVANPLSCLKESAGEHAFGEAENMGEMSGDLVMIHYYRNLKLSEEQKAAVEWPFKPENEGRSMFITGPAGTGKSVVLRSIIDRLKRENAEVGGGDGAKLSNNVSVTASTGIAAWGIGGRTFHSFCGFPFGWENMTAARIALEVKKNRIRSTERVILDEISMLEAKMIDMVDQVFRIVRGRLTEPFGGIQFIFCGDFLQLPPVDSAGEFVSRSAKFAFMSRVWKMLHVVCLTEVFRQGKDPAYAELLGSVRFGQLSQEQEQMLMNRVGCRLDEDDGITATKLYPDNDSANRRNREGLEKLDPSQKHEYRVHMQGNANECNQILGRNGLIQNIVELRPGAQVMLIANRNVEKGLMNGAQGVVMHFRRYGVAIYPVVDFGKDIGQHVVGLYEWTIGPINNPRAIVRQIPLILSWACTIHKSQGLTLQRAEISLRRVFEDAQAYVALSRVQTLGGLSLTDYERSKIRSSRVAVQYMYYAYKMCGKHDPFLERAVIELGIDTSVDYETAMLQWTQSEESVTSSVKSGTDKRTGGSTLSNGTYIDMYGIEFPATEYVWPKDTKWSESAEEDAITDNKHFAVPTEFQNGFGFI